MILSFISNIYNLKWQLLTDKDPDAIHHATNYVNKAKKGIRGKNRNGPDEMGLD
jgi:hypothetical protein